MIRDRNEKSLFLSFEHLHYERICQDMQSIVMGLQNTLTSIEMLLCIFFYFKTLTRILNIFFIFPTINVENHFHMEISNYALY